MAKICKKCGNQLKDTSKFCSKCGTPYIEESNVHNNSPVTVQPQQQAMNPAQTPVSSVPVNKPSNEESSAFFLSKYLKWGIILVVVIGALSMFFGNRSSEKTTAESSKPVVAENAKTNAQTSQASTLKKYPSVIDGAGLISQTDKEKLLSTFREIEEKHNISCAVMTVKSTQGMAIKQYAEAVQDKYFSEALNGSILMVISMEDKKWHITTDSKMRNKVTDEMILGSLKNAFIGDLSKGNYAEAFAAYGRRVDQLLTK